MKEPISLKGAIDKNKGTTFQFSSSNPLWRASLETIDFMPLASANYSGGIIITDWFCSYQPSCIYSNRELQF